MWVVWEISQSAFYTGIAGFLLRSPSALQFLVGPLVDRWSLRRILVGTQMLQGIVMLVLTLATWKGHLSIWLVLVVIPLLSFVNQFVYPAQNAALPRIVDDDELTKANSLLSSAYQAANMIFNASTGILISILGAATLFLIDSITFFVALTLFFGLVIPASSDSEDTRGSDNLLKESYVDDLREGLSYFKGSVLLPLVLGVMIANGAIGGLTGVLPVFADSIGGAQTYGILMATLTGGIFVGTLLASPLDRYPFGRFTIGSFVVSSLSLFLAMTIDWYPAMIGLFFLAFVPVGIFQVSFWALVQSGVDDTLLGRVTSITRSGSVVILPFGSLFAGGIAEVFGSEVFMYILTGALLLLAAFFLVHPSLRSLPSVPEVNESTLGVSAEGQPLSDIDTASSTDTD